MKAVALAVILGMSLTVGAADEVHSQELDTLEVRLARLISEAARPGDADPARDTEIGRLAIRIGRYDEADQRLTHVLAQTPGNREAVLAAAELAWRRYEFDRLERLLQGSASDPELLALRVRFETRRMDFSAAEKALYEHEAAGGLAAQRMLLGAELHYARNQFDDAESLVREAIELAPNLARAHLLLGRLHRLRRESGLWQEETEEAFRLDPLDAEAYAEFAMLLGRQGQLEAGSKHARLALRLDPFCFTAHHYFGRGYSPVEYPDPPWNSQIEPARSALRERRLDDAESGFRSELGDVDNRLSALAGLGVVAFQRDDDAQALAWFFRALDEEIYFGLAHFGVTEVLQRRLDRHNVLLAAAEAQAERHQQPEPPGLRAVFINYDDCSQALRNTVRRFVAPATGYLKPLAESDATVYFLDMHEFLWEAPHSALRGKRTVDLRLYDDLKGLGGAHTVSNKLQQERAAGGRWSVAAHEFAHQLQLVMTRAQRGELKRLFIRAKRENRTLDWYAATNDWEYFAQGYEAYISPEKLSDQKDTSAHTSESLRRRDPELFRFIATLNEREEFRENEIAAWVARGSDWLTPVDERYAALSTALERYDRHPELLIALGYLHDSQGEHNEAAAVYEEALAAAPDFQPALIASHRSRMAAGASVEVILPEVERLVRTLEADHRMLELLGELRLEVGRNEEAAAALERAVALDPYPDPYSPGFNRPYLLLGRAYRALGRLDEAERAMRRSLEEVDRNSSNGWVELATLLQRRQRLVEANDALEIAETLAPDDPAVVQARHLLDTEIGARAGILETVRDYCEGWYEGDGERVRRSLHPALAKRRGTLEADGRVALEETSVEELVGYVEAGAGVQTPPEQRQDRIEILDLSGDIATVKVTAFDLIDYLHLLRTEEGWKIVNVLWVPVDFQPDAKLEGAGH